MSWSASYDPALRVSTGETLTLGRKDDDYPGWQWAQNAAGLGGWLPVDLIGPGGTALTDFDTVELTVSEGDTVTILQRRAGWVWCRTRAGHVGWCPADCIGAD